MGHHGPTPSSRRSPLAHRALAAALAWAVVAVVVTAVSAVPPAGAATPLPRFYAVPSTPPSGSPGTVVRVAQVPSDGLDGTVYRVMYVSRTVTNRPVDVTGIIVVPKTPPPAGGYPVVTWGHGTNGMAEECAPSLQPAQAVPLANDLLDQGWEVTASDYQGEGTPGLLPYLVGVSAARNTIDIVRAARNIPRAHASDDYIVWGHSEGGQTAMFGLHIAQAYAPGLHLMGVVAGAPPSQFDLIYKFLTTSPYRYYLFMAAAGFHAAYGSQRAPLASVLTPAAERLLPVLSQGCAAHVASVIDRYSLAAMVKADPFKVARWSTLLEENDPESFTAAAPAPLLIIQGGADEQIPVASTLLLAQHLCGVGQNLERWIYPGQSHAGVIGPSAPDMIRWMADRFAGQPSPDPYQPTGMPGIETSVCADGTLR